MKTDFGIMLQKYFRDYLPNDRGASLRTISTYRYAFIQFIEFMETARDTNIGEITLAQLNYSNVRDFLRWLENNRHVSVSTTNQRLAALKSFATFVKYEFPEYLTASEEIVKIKSKVNEQTTISYLSPEGMRCLLDTIDITMQSGLRDYTIILLLFLTGIRVSELIAIKGRDVCMSSPRHIVIHGKGNKNRHVPMVKELHAQLMKYAKLFDFTLVRNLDKPLFRNHSGDEFTRQGINYTLLKYAQQAKSKNPELIPEHLSPHKIRHSTAMSLVEQGTELIIIRDLLGHRSIQATEIYAKLSSNRKREAIEKASSHIVPEERPEWEENTSLKEWLKGFKE